MRSRSLKAMEQMEASFSFSPPKIRFGLVCVPGLVVYTSATGYNEMSHARGRFALQFVSHLFFFKDSATGVGRHP